MWKVHSIIHSPPHPFSFKLEFFRVVPLPSSTSCHHREPQLWPPAPLMELATLWVILLEILLHKSLEMPSSQLVGKTQTLVLLHNCLNVSPLFQKWLFFRWYFQYSGNEGNQFPRLLYSSFHSRVFSGRLKRTPLAGDSWKMSGLMHTFLSWR